MGLSSTTVALELKQIGNVSAKIYCVDTWHGSEEHQDLEVIKLDVLFDKFKDNIKRVGVSDMITPMRGSSPDIASNWQGPKLDMIFIDGDHTFKGCYDDILSWNSHLKADGDMFGHDATEDSPVMQAAKRAAEVLNKTVSFFNPPIAHYVWQFQAQPN